MKAALTLILFLVSFSTIHGQNQTEIQNNSESWKEFVSKEAGFKILFPGTPKISSVDVMTAPIKRTNHRFEVSLSRGYFAVHFSDHPTLPNFDKDGLKADYDFLKNSFVKSANAEIISEKEIYLGKKPGREVIFKLKDEAIIDRFFLIDKRLYQNIVSISYSDLDNKIMQEELKKFFDSFELMEIK